MHQTWPQRALIVAITFCFSAYAGDFIFLDGFENNPPEIVSIPVTTATVGQPYSYDVDATDIDDDVLTYFLIEAPLGMEIDSNTGIISWTPLFPEDTPVEVEVRDPPGGTARQSWTINVAAVPDSDMDGLPDDMEAALGTDPNDPDSDNDGLLDGEEVFVYGTDPLDEDSDDDGWWDGAETVVMSDPNDVDSKPTQLISTQPSQLHITLPGTGSDGGLPLNTSVSSPGDTRVLNPGIGSDESLPPNTTAANPSDLGILNPGEGSPEGLPDNTSVASPTSLNVLLPGTGSDDGLPLNTVPAQPNEIEVIIEPEDP